MVSERVRRVVAQALGHPLEQVTVAMTPADSPAWDSLGHLGIVTALELEFSLAFAPEDIMEMNSVAEMIALLERKTGASQP
jgi:acyl carrier protein